MPGDNEIIFRKLRA